MYINDCVNCEGHMRVFTRESDLVGHGDGKLPVPEDLVDLRNQKIIPPRRLILNTSKPKTELVECKDSLPFILS